MGTKNNPGPIDCYAAAAPDEPIFVLRSTDPLAPILVDLWASMREQERGDDPKAREARDVSTAMRRYRLAQSYGKGQRGDERCKTSRALEFHRELPALVSSFGEEAAACDSLLELDGLRGRVLGQGGRLSVLAREAQQIGGPGLGHALSAARGACERAAEEARERIEAAETRGGFTPPSGPADPGRVRFGPRTVAFEAPAAQVLEQSRRAAVEQQRALDDARAAGHLVIGDEVVHVKTTSVLPEGVAAVMVGGGGTLAVLGSDGKVAKAHDEERRCEEQGCRNRAIKGTSICHACYFFNLDGDGEL